MGNWEYKRRNWNFQSTSNGSVIRRDEIFMESIAFIRATSSYIYIYKKHSPSFIRFLVELTTNGETTQCVPIIASDLLNFWVVGRRLVSCHISYQITISSSTVQYIEWNHFKNRQVRNEGENGDWASEFKEKVYNKRRKNKKKEGETEVTFLCNFSKII